MPAGRKDLTCLPWSTTEVFGDPLFGQVKECICSDAVNITSDGTRAKPFCSWKSQCTWNASTEVQQHFYSLSHFLDTAYCLAPARFSRAVFPRNVSCLFVRLPPLTEPNPRNDPCTSCKRYRLPVQKTCVGRRGGHSFGL